MIKIKKFKVMLQNINYKQSLFKMEFSNSQNQNKTQVQIKLKINKI